MIRGPMVRPGVSPGMLRALVIILFAELIIGAVVLWWLS